MNTSIIELLLQQEYCHMLCNLFQNLEFLVHQQQERLEEQSITIERQSVSIEQLTDGNRVSEDYIRCRIYDSTSMFFFLRH